MKKFSFDPVCLIVWLWLFVFCNFSIAISYIIAIILHELGHFLVAKLLGYKLNKYSVTAYGVSLSYFDQNIDYRDEVKIALAGPIVNLICAFVVVGFWWICPSSYFFSYNFVQISIVLALFNLLPCYPMDGARVFIGFSNFFIKDKIAKKITIILNFLLFFVFAILFFVFCFINFNPSYLLIAFFLLMGLFDLQFVSKYEKINIFKKSFKNFVNPNFCLVDTNVSIKEMLNKISTSKTTIFVVVLESGKIINISEKLLIKLSLNYGINTKLNSILN